MSYQISCKKITACRQKFPSIYRIPVLRAYDFRAFACSLIKKRDRVLDIGCSDGAFLYGYLIPAGFSGDYFGMDIDPAVTPVFPLYRSIEDVEGIFDVVVMFEVIEHLQLKTFINHLKHIRNRLLRKGGILLISTPNVYCPKYIHSDVTHRTFYPFHDLYGILAMHGFQHVDIYRAEFLFETKNPLKHLFHTLISGNIFRMLRFDTYANILVVARK